LNICAFKLGQFLPHGLLDRNSAVNELAQVASRIGLDPQEIRPTIESGLTAGARHPRRLPFLKESAQGVAVPPSPKKPDNITERLAKLGETDTDNAQRLATRLGRKVIFTRGRGWLVFDGIRYKPDAELQVMELANLVQQLVICGTKVELHKRRLVQAAQGTQYWMPWTEYQHASEAVADAKGQGAWVLVAEQTTASVRPEQLVPVFPATLVLGAERSGVSSEVVQSADAAVAVPMLGMANSLNIATAAAILLYWLTVRFEETMGA
jgi:tRNA(Leu) C34 or U34 (ribose-2'-O)-methylase TrmL